MINRISTDLANHKVPEGEFVKLVDKYLKKDNPDATIPWSANKPPKWARNFSPRVIVDLGTGVGGFIHSLLVRLGQWGCLNDLKQIVLVESDTSMIRGGESALKAFLLRKTTDALARFQRESTPIDVIVASITINNDNTLSKKIGVLESYEAVDLIVASHITYYFGDGSGIDLIQPLSERYLSTTGKIWCVIRKQQCPIYAARAKMLSQWDIREVKPFDYAEYFQAEVLTKLNHVSILDTRDKDYLADPSFKDRKLVAYMLMWRDVGKDVEAARKIASISNLSDDDAWFSERHFILGGADG